MGTPTTFWGKLRTNDRGIVEWHPLVDHCADVAAVVEALLRLPLWRKRLARLAGRELNDVDCARLCALAALHDIGKFNIGFQAKGIPGLGTTAGHVREALAAVFTGSIFPFLAPLDAWGDGVTELFISAICHHGKPYGIDAAAATWQAHWWTPRGELDPVSGARDLLDRCKIWFPAAFDSSSLALPDAPAFSHAWFPVGCGDHSCCALPGALRTYGSRLLDASRISESRPVL